MPETKRKTHTSTQVKQRYNDKVYTAMTFRVPKELAAEFKRICTDNNISQAQIIKDAMTELVEKYK